METYTSIKYKLKNYFFLFHNKMCSQCVCGNVCVRFFVSVTFLSCSHFSWSLPHFIKSNLIKSALIHLNAGDLPSLIMRLHQARNNNWVALCCIDTHFSVIVCIFSLNAAVDVYLLSRSRLAVCFLLSTSLSFSSLKMASSSKLSLCYGLTDWLPDICLVIY